MMNICGYGFEFDAVALQRKIEDFIGTHKKFFEESGVEWKMKMFNQCTLREYTPLNLLNIFKDYIDERSNYTSVAGVIADIMTSETGINFYAVHISDDHCAILLPENVPWYYNEVEKQLTEEKLNEIFKKYFAELDFPHGISDLRYLSLDID